MDNWDKLMVDLDTAIARLGHAVDNETPVISFTPLPKGKWCTCGIPHETGGPCWECRDGVNVNA